MKIVVVQYEPSFGKVEENIAVVENLISSLEPDEVDLLALPELCFTGFSFQSREEVEPLLEVVNLGPTCCWAKSIARRFQCYVSIGFPERDANSSRYYNSVLLAGPDGETVSVYRKHFLYYVDENWADEGPFFTSLSLASLRLCPENLRHQPEVLQRPIKVGLGICMDINPYKFKADWNDFEFARFHERERTELLIMHNNWLSANIECELSSRSDSGKSELSLNDTSTGSLQSLESELEEDFAQPDWSSLRYWFVRLTPLINATEEDHSRTVTVVVSNRTGVERKNHFVGSSCVFVIKRGKIHVLGTLAKKGSGLLHVTV